jgi:hypothetical protein
VSNINLNYFSLPFTFAFPFQKKQGFKLKPIVTPALALWAAGQRVSRMETKVVMIAKAREGTGGRGKNKLLKNKLLKIKVYSSSLIIG